MQLYLYLNMGKKPKDISYLSAEEQERILKHRKFCREYYQKNKYNLKLSKLNSPNTSFASSQDINHNSQDTKDSSINDNSQNKVNVNIELNNFNDGFIDINEVHPLDLSIKNHNTLELQIASVVNKTLKDFFSK